MAIGTIRAETGRFEPLSEFVSRFNTSPNGHPLTSTIVARIWGTGEQPDGSCLQGPRLRPAHRARQLPEVQRPAGPRQRSWSTTPELGQRCEDRRRSARLVPQGQGRPGFGTRCLDDDLPDGQEAGRTAAAHGLTGVLRSLPDRRRAPRLSGASRAGKAAHMSDHRRPAAHPRRTLLGYASAVAALPSRFAVAAARWVRCRDRRVPLLGARADPASTAAPGARPSPSAPRRTCPPMPVPCSTASGQLGAPELVYPPTAGWWRKHDAAAACSPSAGGGGAYLAFTNGPTATSFYTAIGRGWGEKAGVAVEKNGKRDGERAVQEQGRHIRARPRLSVKAGIDGGHWPASTCRGAKHQAVA